METTYHLPDTASQSSLIRPDVTRPASFEPGREYLWLNGNEKPAVPVLIPVKFIQYDACPAFVIVLVPSGKRIRCPRDDLFLQ